MNTNGFLFLLCDYLTALVVLSTLYVLVFNHISWCFVVYIFPLCFVSQCLVQKVCCWYSGGGGSIISMTCSTKLNKIIKVIF